MNIVHIIPGTGDAFYCQNCMRDKDLVMALRRLGHEVVLVPMYLPLFSEGEDFGGPQVPVFYGAVSVYLSQKLPGYRFIARWFRRWLDSRPLLERVSRKAGTTRARGLEGMTLSVLQGEYGAQKRELDRLVGWLKAQERPELVHLSSALLLGLAGRLRHELKVPVFCSLQDENTWIDSMEPGAARQAWDLMSEKARDITVFTPVSQYYSAVMQAKLKGIPAARFQVVPIGVETARYGLAEWNPERPVLGYLSRLSESLGVGVLVEAFIRIHERGRIKNLRLRLSGGMTPEDVPFIESVKRNLARRNLLDLVEFVPAFDRLGRRAFLQSLTVLSVPTPAPEAFGLFMVEAMASGVPVIQPRLGAFPEIMAATGGGRCYEPGDLDGLVSGVESLLGNESQWRLTSQAGRAAVRAHYDAGRTAEAMSRLYANALKI